MHKCKDCGTPGIGTWAIGSDGLCQSCFEDRCDAPREKERTRYARVFGLETQAPFRRYAFPDSVEQRSMVEQRIFDLLPSNYEQERLADAVFITGQDSYGWTLDEYVIPRLGSGLICAEEITEQEYTAFKDSLEPSEWGYNPEPKR